MEKSSVFEIGKVYEIRCYCGTVYHNSKIVDFDDHFLSIIYKEDGLSFNKILNFSVISNARLEDTSTKVKYFYFGCFEGEHFGSPRYGIKEAYLTPEEVQINRDNDVHLFEVAKDAKEYLFSQIKSGLKSEYYVWCNNNCALYNHCGGEWDGDLAGQYRSWEQKNDF